MKFLKSIVFICLLSITAFAQEKCGVRQNEKLMQKMYPNLVQSADDYAAHVREVMAKIDYKKLEKNTRGQYIIPVVFHILHLYPTSVNDLVKDQQVFEEMVYLNQNYSKTNIAGLNSLVLSWKDSAADCGFEFRLARKDPNGNCTNGIDRIFTAKTNDGDNDSKLNQWPNQYYLNVWVANAIRGDQGVGGTLAFALKPASVAGAGGAFFFDGIIMKHKWLGNSGTYQGNDHYTLTHEIGHYLGLDHVWGGTNQPGVECGDDGVGDTPESEGHSSCTNADLYDSLCKGTQDPVDENVGVIHNTQNFMEYSGCGAMYTKGQKALMISNLDDYFYRGSLVDSLAHAYTGVLTPAGLCPPIADYHSTKRFVCVGTSTTINDYSYNGGSTSRTWDFPNGTPATSTALAPSVAFNTVGWQPVTLNATNANGTNTKTQDYIWAADPSPVSIVGVGAGKIIADFEGPNSYPKWPIFNYFNNNFKWEHEFQAGYDGGQSIRYQVVDKRAPFQRTTNSSDRDFDDIYSEGYDLTTLSGPINLNLWTSGASFTANPIVWDPEGGPTGAGANISVINDSMNIFYSNDCGNTWKYLKGYKASDLHNNGYVGTEFRPTSISQWVPRTIPLNATIAGSNKVFFRFRFFPSAGGNNFYMDNIGISNYATGVTPILKGNSVFVVYPNPSNGNNLSIKISDNLVEQNEIHITDLTGKVLYATTAKNIVNNGGAIALNNSLTNGIYLVSVVNKGKTITSQKLAIQK
jgi:hypothetical protein